MTRPPFDTVSEIRNESPFHQAELRPRATQILASVLGAGSRPRKPLCRSSASTGTAAARLFPESLPGGPDRERGGAWWGLAPSQRGRVPPATPSAGVTRIIVAVSASALVLRALPGRDLLRGLLRGVPFPRIGAGPGPRRSPRRRGSRSGRPWSGSGACPRGGAPRGFRLRTGRADCPVPVPGSSRVRRLRTGAREPGPRRFLRLPAFQDVLAAALIALLAAGGY